MGALSHIRVLDLSRVLAGPYATQILADLGADVVKVERPGAGDDTRGWGPPFAADGTAAYYFAANRNKRSIAIDLAHERARALVLDLAARADVVVENFKTGGAAKLGLDGPDFLAVNPRIVHCAITGFGRTGPYAKRPGYDYLIQAMGGLMSITGAPDEAPGGEPMKVGVAVADLFTGLFAANAIQGALLHAQRTGEGQSIDLALFDCQIAMLANQAMNHLIGGGTPQRLGNAHPNVAPYQPFQTADGWAILAIGNDGQFARFCAIAGLDALPADPRFRDNAGRVRNRPALADAIAPAMSTRTTADWVALLEAAEVPCGPINDIAAVFADPQTASRAMRTHAVRADGLAVDLVGSPMKLSATPVEGPRAPPALGADAPGVLADWLGLDGPAVAALRAAGVLA